MKIRESHCGWNMKCEGILVRDKTGKVYGGQVIRSLLSWLRHLDIILKAEWSHRRIFSDGNGTLRYAYLKITRYSMKIIRRAHIGTGNPVGRHLKFEK